MRSVSPSRARCEWSSPLPLRLERTDDDDSTPAWTCPLRPSCRARSSALASSRAGLRQRPGVRIAARRNDHCVVVIPDRFIAGQALKNAPS